MLLPHHLSTPKVLATLKPQNGSKGGQEPPGWGPLRLPQEGNRRLATNPWVAGVSKVETRQVLMDSRSRHVLSSATADPVVG